MNTTFSKNHIGAFVVASALLSVCVVSSARAQGRHGGGGVRSSSSSSGRSGSSSSRSSSSSSSRRSNSGSGSSRSSNSSSGRGGSRSDGQGRNNGNSTRVEGQSRDRSRDNNSQSLIRNRVGDRDRNKDRDRDGDTDGDRGRHHRHRGRDGDRDSVEWRRKEFDRGRYLYHTRVYQSSNYGNYSYSSNAYERGYEDGLYTGANDARRGESYDPDRSHLYKHGASGFISIFGAPDTYRLAYRDGFLRGYEEGYRRYDVYFTGGRFHR